MISTGRRWGSSVGTNRWVIVLHTFETQNIIHAVEEDDYDSLEGDVWLGAEISDVVVGWAGKL